MKWDDVDLDFHNDWSMLTINMDYDNALGHIVISALKNGINIVMPTVEIGFPYLDRPDSTHMIGVDLPGLNFFNGFIWDFELHNIVLP